MDITFCDQCLSHAQIPNPVLHTAYCHEPLLFDTLYLTITSSIDAT